MPDDFDAAEAFPGADASSQSSIQASFPLLFLLRWLTLRSEVSILRGKKEGCIELYSRGLPRLATSINKAKAFVKVCVAADQGRRASEV